VTKPSAPRLPAERWACVVRDAPLVSIDLIVRDSDDRVLLGLRTNRPAKGTWFVPGGVIRKGEHMADAFRRLSKDELGAEYELDSSRLLGVYEHLYEDNFLGEPGFGTHYVVIGRELRLREAPDELPKEQHARYRWLAVEDLLADESVHHNTKAYFVV